jgi:hypothetical protein
MEVVPGANFSVAPQFLQEKFSLSFGGVSILFLGYLVCNKSVIYTILHKKSKKQVILCSFFVANGKMAKDENLVR